MTNKQLQRLCQKYLVGEPPGFTAARGLLFMEPVRHILRACGFQSSNFEPGGVYAGVSVTPLFVPANAIYGIFGDDVGGGCRVWVPTGENEASVMQELLAAIRAEGLPLLERLMTPADLVQGEEHSDADPDDPYLRQAIAYSCVLSPQPLQRGLAELDRLLDILERIMAEDEYDRSWPRAMAARARHLKWTVEQSRDEAVRLLNMWRMQTLMNLGLEKHAAEVPDTYEGVLRMYEKQDGTD
jgi:hypothetical protein